MGKQVAFFEKNFLDLDNDEASITASQGEEFAQFVRARSLSSAWVTTDSVDADEPNVDWDLGAPYEIDTILLVDHNLKSFVLELYDADTGLWSEVFSKTDETEDTTEISVEAFYGQRMRLRVLGTQDPDTDKRIARIIVTKKIGQFSYWPKIESPVLDQGKTARTVLSGKRAILRTVGAFACKLTLDHWRNAADIELIRKLYAQVEGFELWLCGGDEEQFFVATEIYRKKDIYLVGLSNDFSPEFVNGIYVNGMKISLALVEVVR